MFIFKLLLLFFSLLFGIRIKRVAASFIEPAEHLIVFQTEYLDADDQTLESAYEQVSGDDADPVRVSAFCTCKLQDHFHDGRVADSKGADTDK